MDLPWFIWLETFEHLPGEEKIAFRLVNREWAASINHSLYNLLEPEEDLLKRIGRYARSIIPELEPEYLKMVKQHCPRLAHIVLEDAPAWVSAETMECFEIIASMASLVSLTVKYPFSFDTLPNFPLGSGLKMLSLDLSEFELKQQAEYISSLVLPNLVFLQLSGLIPSTHMVHYSKLTSVRKVHLQYVCSGILVTNVLIPPLEKLEKATIVIDAPRPSHQLPDPRQVPKLQSIAFITSGALELFRPGTHTYPSVKHIYLESAFNMLGKIQQTFPNCVSFELFLDGGNMPNLSHDIYGIKWLNLSLDPRNVFKSKAQVESLTTLSINDTLFSWAIACLPNLENLRLTGSKLLKATKTPPDNLRAMPSLVSLYILGKRDDSYYKKLLPNLPNLRHIYSDDVGKNKAIILKVLPAVRIHPYVPMENIIRYHGA